MAWPKPKTKLTADLLAEAWAYVELCTAKGDVPTVEKLAITLIVHRDTLYACVFRPSPTNVGYGRPRPKRETASRSGRRGNGEYPRSSTPITSATTSSVERRM